MKNLSLSLIICLSGLAATSHAADKLQDPNAICAHVSRGELAVAADEFKRLSEIPVNWVRTDYDWSGIQPNQEKWNYDHLDKLI
ncbi:MAG: hypothetical protein J6W23_05340, partial [Victivallales bacterium]|nr:hypothetical protein [Victivallales bacterium]